MINVKLGNVVTANTVDLMSINQVEPIYVTFSVPEAQLPAIKRYMAEGKLPVRAQPQDNPESAETGVLTFVDNAVDMTTGTIKLKGTFPNTDRRLWPGEFVRVTLRLTTQANAVVVPNEAVQTGQNGSFVYVVKAGSHGGIPAGHHGRARGSGYGRRPGTGTRRDGGYGGPVAPGAGQPGSGSGRGRGGRGGRS